MNKLVAYALMASLCAGCMSTTSKGAGAQRKQLIMVSHHFVERRGDHTFKRLVKQDNPDVYQAQEQRLVNIMNQLIPYADEYVEKDEKIDWAIHEWNAKKIDTKALGNGAILISSQFTQNKDLTDADLAFLIAQDMAHIIRHHPQEYYSWKYFVSPVLFASSFLTSGVASIAASASQDLYGIGFKHSAEKEADLLGLEIYAKAGFDPENAVHLVEKIEPLFKHDHPFKAKIPALLRSQPSFKAKQKYMEAYQTHVRQMYEKHVDKTSKDLIEWDFKQNANPPDELLKAETAKTSENEKVQAPKDPLTR